MDAAAGSEPGAVFVNGGKQTVTRPRVRTHDGQEVKLESYRAAGDPLERIEFPLRQIVRNFMFPHQDPDRPEGGRIQCRRL
jgi:hypothetical protein